MIAVRVGDGIAEPMFGMLLDKVAEEKRSRILRFRHREDAVRTLSADLLVRAWLMERLGWSNHEIAFTANEYGKPALAGRGGNRAAGLHFNVSHAGEWVAAAFDRSAVGIDVEGVDAVPLDLAGRILTPAELSVFNELPADERKDGLCRFWTRKESYVKAVGKGLSLPLRGFSVLPAETGVASRVGDGGGQAEWFCKTFALDSAYRLSVCAQSRGFPDRADVWEFKRLTDVFSSASVRSRLPASPPGAVT
ncbi:4'-phosphopantetheinyl transferase superfamily protein [Cohnella sp. CFH 77786]|uniref:4'-phosphopantetheinyl transferase family protein n=1 Tax=Cohnella sp. CFH 77786 TaxID=2662265 RepID=UPI00351CF918